MLKFETNLCQYTIYNFDIYLKNLKHIHFPVHRELKDFINKFENRHKIKTLTDDSFNKSFINGIFDMLEMKSSIGYDFTVLKGDKKPIIKIVFNL